MNDAQQTLLEAVRYFSDLDTCNAYMQRIKWPDGKIVCPKCGAKGDRIGEIATRKMLRCKDCRCQFSHKVGTIFEESPLGLDKWFVAVWCVANHKNGISSHELARAIGVRQPSAWFMLHRIREAMRCEEFTPDDKFDGPRRDSWALNRRGKMPEAPKPEGWRAFDSLAKRLVKVPKEQIDAKVAKSKAARAKKRSKTK